MHLAESWKGGKLLHGHRRTNAMPSGRNVLLLAIAIVLTLTCVSAGLLFSDGSSSATGIVPPANPAVNTPPRIPFACNNTGDDVSAACIDSALYNINYARSLEGVGPMSLPTNYAELTIPQQFLAVVNLERAARGLSPEYGLGSAMDQQAQQGAGAGTDPHLVSSGNFVDTGGVASGSINPLVADYSYLYEDGYGGNNLACTSSTASGCWLHRSIILNSACATGSCTLVMGAAFSTSPAGTELGQNVSSAVFGDYDPGTPPSSQMDFLNSSLSYSLSAGSGPAPVAGMAATPSGNGYWLVRSDGTVDALGKAANEGDLAGTTLNAPIVAMATTPDGGGYWLVSADGGIFTFGDAYYYGSAGNLQLDSPVVGMAVTPDGKGYWLVASDGGVFSFGDAHFYGSMGAAHLNQPIVGVATDSATGGYWLVASDGGIFSFNAPFYGSTGGIALRQPIVGMEAGPSGSGYRLVAADGGIFSFNLPFEGSEGGTPLNQPIVAMAAEGTTDYWLVARDGGIFTFGGAGFYGSGA
jgi:hypothetical protein